MAGKRALLIGIDRYPKLPEANQLRGCVNDVDAMALLLQNRFGFPSEGVAVLRNDAATQRAIREAAEALIASTEQDDVVVLHYSGHGSQRSSADPTEGDGLDETIVPFDSGRRPSPNLDITDKEINGWVLRLNEKTRNLTLVFDCCHSGTITRDVFAEAGRAVDPDLRPVEEMGIMSPEGPRPADVEAGEPGTREPVRGPSGWLPLSGRYVLIAGCLDSERSHELEAGDQGAPVAHGALTYFLTRELSRAQPDTTYRDVFERVCLGVATRYRDQHPQMEGDARDRELFGTRDVEPMRFVPVSSRAERAVTLAGGAAFGLVAGSEWDVHPEGTKQPNPSRRLGRVRVDEVRAVSSLATLVEEAAPGSVLAGARAVEVAHAFGDQRLAVDIQGPPAAKDRVAAMAAAVEASPFLRRTEGSAADLRVYDVEPRTEAGEADPVPQLRAITSDSWVVVGRDGKLVMPVHLVDEPDVIRVVADNLEKIARFRGAVVLANPDPGALLRGTVDLTLQARGADGSWADALPSSAGGQVVFTEGDPIAFRIANRHTAPLYVTVLDFGLTGRIAQVHPPAGAADRLDPWMEIRVGVESGRELPVEFPHDFPFAPEPGEADPVEGLETLKLFATTGRPVNFDALLQGGVRADGAGEWSPLGRLLSAALQGQGLRDLPTQRLDVPPDEQWITVDRPFLLRRKGGS